MRDQKTISSYLLTNILVLLFFLTEKNAIAVDAFVPISSSNNRNINCRLSSSALLADPNFDVSSLLYAEQEKALVTRGKVEEELLAQNGSLLEANIVKGVGGGGGFGGGEASQKARLKSQAKSHAKILKEQGVIRIDHVLRPTELVDGIRESVYQMRETSEQLVASGELPSLEHFANVLLKKNRCDMTIPIGPEWVAKALESVLIQSPVGIMLQTLLGKKAILRELSCLMSDPNSDRQVVHPDTPCQSRNEEPVLYTCFIALQDISLDMGPTTWLPGTHNLEIHQQFQNESQKDDLLKNRDAVLGTLRKGDCAIFDSRLLHCGGANISDKSRALLYFSFQNPKVVNVGNPPSIRPSMVGKWNLKDLQKELELYGENKATSNLLFDTE